MAIIWVKADRVVAIPGIHNGLLHVGWDLAGKLEWGLDWEGLSLGMFVEGLEIYGPSWVSIGFCSDHHPRQPSCRSIVRHFFQHSQCNITFKVSFDSVLPVERYRGDLVTGNWFSSRVHVQLERGTSHHRELLVFTDIEYSAGIMVQQPLLQHCWCLVILDRNSCWYCCG